MTGIGIDTGGTCTDAVIYDLEKKIILASAKSATTHEKLEIGIGKALGKLPDGLVRQASCISLSTTLATNACVENKGGRVCLIFIGVRPETLEESYEKYGFEGIGNMRFLEADPANDTAPDWERFEKMLPQIFEEYDSIAVSQVLPRENNGAYETEARKRILAKKKITVVCAYEIFKDLNVIKRGAGALLNARLIPVIENFFEAVRHVLDEKQIDLPFLIMRSDGSLVSEQYSRQYPVETLLCGPTASVKGAMELMNEREAVVVDMGGTTSDIALIKNGAPKTDSEGVSVGKWQTFVKGIDIDTFALGGDSHVGYREGGLFLQDRRVLPVSSLADAYPQVLEEMELRAKQYCGSARPLYEHLILMKPPCGKEKHYTETELEICRILEDEPLGICRLAEKMDIDVYLLDTKRLEKEGILLRSGFTPTDAMVLKGDRTEMEHQEEAMRAAEYAAGFIAKSARIKTEEVAEKVYDLVREKLFCSLVRILWEDAHDGKTAPAGLYEFAKEAFIQEKALQTSVSKKQSGSAACFYKNTFSTDAVFLGVGAPIHVFLEDVAKMFHTGCTVSSHSGICNALGALLGDACVYETVHIRADYVISHWDTERETFIVYGEEKKSFEKIEEAIDYAGERAKARAKKKVLECGAQEIYYLDYEVKKKEGATNLGSVLLGAEVTACARGKYFRE
ncbi:MAG: hydantoinase/oxoprolinase family protein [Eubacterium sp.]|nr:hydantoinase/oxoprolinase family protein [Eubacterium sp.]